MVKPRNGSTVVGIDREEGTITLANPRNAADFEVGIPITVDFGRGFWARAWVFVRELPGWLRSLWDNTRWL